MNQLNCVCTKRVVVDSWLYILSCNCSIFYGIRMRYNKTSPFFYLLPTTPNELVGHFNATILKCVHRIPPYCTRTCEFYRAVMDFSRVSSVNASLLNKKLKRIALHAHCSFFYLEMLVVFYS